MGEDIRLLKFIKQEELITREITKTKRSINFFRNHFPVN